MKNKKQNLSNIKVLSKEEISFAKGGKVPFGPGPMYLCKYGMNCYKLRIGPCPAESGSIGCP